MNSAPDVPTDNHSARAHLARVLLLAVLLAAAWLLWSGFFKPLILMLGALSCAIVLITAHRMHLFDTDIFALRFTARLFRFWLWLGREIVRSSLEVTRIVLNPKLPIKPTVVEFDAHCEHPVDRVILGNSITLTPGTLTLSLDDQHFTVHALTEEGARDIQDGEMDRLVSELRSR
ncbi:MAG: Na+/H+ antiporter subunit E [Xanthomonadales bacterium]|nr:Na+/H+ antiporter subunit E [Gammaproteobacteria bacterium]MBT8054425.1 Na+/H+ antiporter subunit E [Gammaproteobacteria bacterium]NND58439.1 Na+/H+ antiporter subunit E [Xanthomonadales bacterium]NNK50140.1 Na+/H+ antiporter subunit E [Xanthomonadales bacterium]NNL95183.1 Na+/H+ antiporter subunit E [Xanthomonadales bacterium]